MAKTNNLTQSDGRRAFSSSQNVHLEVRMKITREQLAAGEFGCWVLSISFNKKTNLLKYVERRLVRKLHYLGLSIDNHGWNGPDYLVVTVPIDGKKLPQS